jgi:TonB family protein
MKTLEFWVLAYLVNSLWQVPLLFAAGWLAARAVRPLGATVQHRVWVMTLVLESVLPAISILPWPNVLPFWHGREAGQGHVNVILGSGTAAGAHAWSGIVLAGLTAFYVLVTGYFAARFAWRTGKVAVMRREAMEITLTGEPALFWSRWARKFDLHDVAIAASSRVFAPVTLGARKLLLLLPASMENTVSDQDLCTVIAHEFAHMRRRDFLKNMLYELLSLPVTYHPCLPLTRTHIMESREMICDQIAASVTGPGEYTQSLLRLASLLVTGMPVRQPHTIGILDSKTFERRLMNLTEKQQPIKRARGAAIFVACAILGLGVCGSAAAMGMHAEDQAGADSNQGHAPKQLSIPANVMQGNLINKTVPAYPADAKKAGVEGTVVLQAIISKDGNIENLRVLSGPEKLQQSSLDAVRQWKYKPYLLNGDPVQVETKISVVYSLKGVAGPPAS